MAALAGGGLILGQVMDYKFTTDALERRIDRLEAYIQARRDLEQAS
jgi:type II secretory pathway component PulM